jgi:hypothetical protein
MPNQKSTEGYVGASVNQKPIRHGIIPVTCADILVSTNQIKKKKREKNKRKREMKEMGEEQKTDGKDGISWRRLSSLTFPSFSRSA